MTIRRERLALSIAAVLMACLPFILTWRLWTPVAADRRYLAEGDLSSQYYPLRYLASIKIANGELPLWNPYIFGGSPGLADIQMATFYPPQLLSFLAVGRGFGYGNLQLQAVLHLSLAGIGMLLLGRRLLGNLPAALAASLAFTVSGYLTAFPVQQVTILATVAWLPWLLLVVERLLFGPASKGKGIASLAVFFALAILAGHPQTVLLVSYLITAYAAWRIYGMSKGRMRAAMRVLLGLALGVFLSALQLLPTLQYITLSSRAGLGYDQVSQGFSLTEVVAVLYPGFFGGTPQYLGAIPLFLAVLAVIVVPLQRAIFWAVLSLTGLLLSFGGATFLYPVFYLLLPGMSTSRNQERAILLFVFGMSILVGQGVAALAPGRARQALKRSHPIVEKLPLLLFLTAVIALLLFAGTRLPPLGESDINLFGGILKQHFWLLLSLGLTCLFLYWLRAGLIGEQWLQWSLILLLATNLLSVNWQFHLGSPPPAVTQPSTEIVTVIKQQLPDGYRVATGGLLPEGPNAGLLYSLPDITGNTPLSLSTFAEFEVQVSEWRRWQLLSVAYVLLPERAEANDDLTLVYPGHPSLYRVNAPLAPARLLHEAIAVEPADVWSTIASDEFVPERQVVVARGLDITLATATGPESIVLNYWSGSSLTASAVVRTPALAVFSLTSYPGWQAYVDGQATEWLTCNGTFICVPLAEGEHNVRLNYSPPVFSAGVAITGVALLCITLLIAMPERQTIL